MNKIIITGNLGRDPEQQYTPAGKQTAKFSVGVKDGDKTLWFNVTAWEKTAEYVNSYLKKGNKVLVEGRLQFDPATGGPRIWTRKDGSSAAAFEVNANTVEGMTQRDKQDAAAPQGQRADYRPGIDDEQFPF